jgi:hypothetical protein
MVKIHNIGKRPWIFNFNIYKTIKLLILTFPSPSHNLVSCKWILKIKYNANGSMARHEVCLVAKEFTQVEGIDFNKTFSPIARWNQLELCL